MPKGRYVDRGSKLEFGCRWSDTEEIQWEALERIQNVLLWVLQTYWLPSYILHILASNSIEVLQVRDSVLNADSLRFVLKLFYHSMIILI